MANKSFREIVSMIVNTCNSEFYHGTNGNHSTILECATQIYIAQMQRGDNNAKEKE
jgi:hypothetical protein